LSPLYTKSVCSCTQAYECVVFQARFWATSIARAIPEVFTPQVLQECLQSLRRQAFLHMHSLLTHSQTNY